MAVTVEEIRAWLSANPTADDRTIAAAMDQHGVTPQQMASAANLSTTEVQRRYNAAKAPAQTGMLYQSLGSGATHQQIIDAYNQWIQSQGGRSTQATLNEAGDYLRSLGIPESVIQQSGARFGSNINPQTLAQQIAQLAMAGDNAGAYNLYQQSVNQYGFTPTEFASALNGQFTPQQISEWAAQGAAGAFNQPVQPPAQGGMMSGPSFNYGDDYWNQVGGAYQRMFGSQGGLHVPELKSWYANQGWTPGQPIATQPPQQSVVQTMFNTNDPTMNHA